MIGFYLRGRNGLELREPCRDGGNLPEMIGVLLEPGQDSWPCPGALCSEQENLKPGLRHRF